MSHYKALAKEMHEVMRDIFGADCRSCDMGIAHGEFKNVCNCILTKDFITPETGRRDDCPFLKFENLKFEDTNE